MCVSSRRVTTVLDDTSMKDYKHDIGLWFGLGLLLAVLWELFK